MSKLNMVKDDKIRRVAYTKLIKVICTEFYREKLESKDDKIKYIESRWAHLENQTPKDKVEKEIRRLFGNPEVAYSVITQGRYKGFKIAAERITDTHYYVAVISSQASDPGLKWAIQFKKIGSWWHVTGHSQCYYHTFEVHGSKTPEEVWAAIGNGGFFFGEDEWYCKRRQNPFKAQITWRGFLEEFTNTEDDDEDDDDEDCDDDDEYAF